MRRLPGPRFSGVSVLLWGLGLAAFTPDISTA
jgi:hypothetical protein